MTIPQQENVNSLQMLARTINNDPFVFRWFLLLISQPEIQLKLKSNEGTRNLYAELKSSLSWEKRVSLLLLCFLSTLFLLKIKALFFYCVCLVYLSVKFYLKKKQSVTGLSLHIVSQDYEDAVLKQTTLFQMCERYSRQYSIPSLVDKISSSDQILRYTFFTVLVVMFFVFPFFTTFENELFLILICCSISLLLRTNILYNHIK